MESEQKAFCYNIKITVSDDDKTFKRKNTVAKEIFNYLIQKNRLESENLLLSSSSKEILSYFPLSITQEEYDSMVLSIPNSPSDKQEFYLVSKETPDDTSVISAVADELSFLMSIFCRNEVLNSFIFDALDTLPNSICVYDNKLNLIYANADFCRYTNIEGREHLMGKFINDILIECGTTITSTNKPYDYMKINDVIKYKEPVVDWEVVVGNENDSSQNMIASNDMYPLLDNNGKVRGVAEISRSRKTKIKQVSDTMGLTADYTFDDIIGNSIAINKIKSTAMSFANSPYNVLIYGESGVGKELFAQSIHNHSTRRSKPFVALNCASISPELIDSELFGYESGAFTGASKNGHIGKFEICNGGTLFFDEVAELPLSSQTKLLRTLEMNQITRIGGTKNIPVDVRVIAATNRSLEKMIQEGLFREDLYYRLMVLNIVIPPLRERKEDILDCCEFFMLQAKRINNSSNKLIDDEAKQLLMNYDWPGNTRELRNIINRVYVMTSSNNISRETLINAFQSNEATFEKLPEIKTPEEMILDKRLAIDSSYVELLKEALLLVNGSKTDAAKLLGVSRKTIYNMLEKYKDYFDQ